MRKTVISLHVRHDTPVAMPRCADTLVVPIDIDKLGLGLLVLGPQPGHLVHEVGKRSPVVKHQVTHSEEGQL